MVLTRDTVGELDSLLTALERELGAEGRSLSPLPRRSQQSCPSTPPETIPSSPKTHLLPSSSSSSTTTTDPHDSTSEAPLTTTDLCSSQALVNWFSLSKLRQLTDVIFKSGPPTPTRALSTANSHSDGRDTPNRSSHDGAETSGTQTPRNSGSHVPVAKGKLKIKITEARGLRKSRDPYVIAVFQRSELISGPPRPTEPDDHFLPTSGGLGGIPIQRQASDSGRPMSIPMRSRQSSNTSVSDYNTFRNRPHRIPSANPKWDAEAIL
ncbi:hypothetical protein ESCO_004896 [Escovopsis weberi]|uniref:Uncharacterized protein n=1 Tax=Escovopsis weberi TaxID=150374 RepID=A0A0M8MPV2_ESCWE|nr:hypothetical protein ESCO_004896 [Escovopsis weberi]